MGVLYDVKYKLWQIKKRIEKNSIIALENNKKIEIFKKENKSCLPMAHNIYKLIISEKVVAQEDILKFTHNKMELEVREKLCDCLNYFKAENIDNFYTASNNLIEFIFENYKDISFEILQLIEESFILFGDFKFSYKVRKFNQKHLIENYYGNNKIPSKYFMQLYWALDENKLIREREELEQRLNKIYKVSEKETINFFFSLLKGEKTSNFNKYNKYFKNSDYLNLIKDKKIAIVGPAEGETELKQIREEFDIIININNFNYNEELKSPDIVYFNGGTGRKFIALEDVEQRINRLKRVVFKGLPPNSDFNIKFNNCRESIPNIGELIFGDNPNMIQQIVIDILYFKPKKVKIFNTNFYLSKTRYSKDYISYNNGATKLYQRSGFAAHNFLSQFLFIKKLYENNVVDIDKIGKEYFKLATDEFVEKFDEIHKNEKLL